MPSQLTLLHLLHLPLRQLLHPQKHLRSNSGQSMKKPRSAGFFFVLMVRFI
jgi:hypothetical protein